MCCQIWVPGQMSRVITTSTSSWAPGDHVQITLVKFSGFFFALISFGTAPALVEAAVPEDIAGQANKAVGELAVLS